MAAGVAAVCPPAGRRRAPAYRPHRCPQNGGACSPLLLHRRVAAHRSAGPLAVRPQGAPPAKALSSSHQSRPSWRAVAPPRRHQSSRVIHLHYCRLHIYRIVAVDHLVIINPIPTSPVFSFFQAISAYYKLKSTSVGRLAHPLLNGVHTTAQHGRNSHFRKEKAP